MNKILALLAMAGALCIFASCGGPDKPAAGSAPPVATEPDLTGAAVWDDPANDPGLWKPDPRAPIDIIKVWAVRRGNSLCVGAKFKDAAEEFWKKPDEQGDYRNRLFMQFYMNADGNYNTGGKAEPKGGPGFDLGIQFYASAKYRDKRTGEIKKGVIGAQAADFEFLEPDFFYTLHTLPSSVGFGMGDRMYKDGPWSDDVGDHLRMGKDWVEFDVPLEVIKLESTNGKTITWLEVNDSKGGMARDTVIPFKEYP